MNKKLFILSACLLAIATSVTMAQESVIFFDVRPNDTGSGVRSLTGNLGASGANPFNNDTVNAGKRGQGQIMRLEPTHGDGYESVQLSGQFPANGYPNFDGDLNRSTGDLWLYMDVFDDTAGTGDVISSVGLDIDLVPAGTIMRAKPGSLAMTLDNGTTVFNSITPPGSGAPWNNKVDGEVVPASDPLDWRNIKAVRVPVDSPAVYNAALGIVNRAAGPTDAPYRLGKPRVTSGARNCTQRVCPATDPNCALGSILGGHAKNSSYDVFLKVNNLLITRVFNGVGDSPAQENVSLGYGALIGAASASPELPAINGNTNGGVSLVPDARIEVRLKGDYTNDGNVTNSDNVQMQNAAFTDATDNQWQAYCGDFTGSATVTSSDVGVVGLGGFGFLGAQTRSATCP